MVARALALLAILGCSGRSRPDNATRSDPGVAAGDAAPGDGAARASDGGPPAPPTGDLQVRVEWPDVPVVARSSPGVTPCRTPRAAAVAPTVTWGVPDALVVIDGAGPPLGEARITLADCALAPRLAVGSALVIVSAVDRPAQVAVRRQGGLDQPAADPPIPVGLPIAGHAVELGLAAGSIYAIETRDPAPEVAYVAALPGGQVTDAAGQVTAQGLTVGDHAVTAWLAPRAGQPARLGRGAARVVAGELAELTIALAPLPVGPRP